jgi:hypothetical protein
MRDMRRERVKPTAGFLAARSLEVARLDRLAKEAAAGPFAVAGSYDRSAIMKAAVASARAQKAKGSKLLVPARRLRSQEHLAQWQGPARLRNELRKAP